MAQADNAPPPAKIGRFEVRQSIGKGGMGVVYAAYDPELDREVAVKLLRADRMRGSLAAASEQLRAEAQTTAKLAHPNVVTIFDVGAHDGSVYIAMELVDGPSLRSWISETPRPWREKLAMMFQAGLGLAAAHDAGLIHRDFKPGNVLIGNNRARVVDFGLARSGDIPSTTPPADTGDVLSTAPEAPATKNIETTDILSTSPGQQPLDESVVGVTHDGLEPATMPHDVTTTGLFVGTPAYMAPELFTGGGADARTDQFAFCVALYEALFDYRPFVGDTAAKIGEQVLAGNIVEPPERTRVPKWLINIVTRGLATEPADRHPSIKSLLASISFTARIMWD